jgi:3-methyl-2-oxobutanoate hydroxymethyltransferase
VQVWHDLLGLYTDFLPRHAKRYASLAELIGGAIGSYIAEVRSGDFPGPEHSASMPDDSLRAALAQADEK